MRIAIAINSLAMGGAQKVMVSLAYELFNMGHEPHFLLMSKTNIYELPQGIKVHVCLEQSVKNINRMFHARSVVKELKDNIQRIEKHYGKFDLFLSNLDDTNLLMSKVSVQPLYMVIHASINAELNRHAKMGPIKYSRKLNKKIALNNHNLVTVSKGIEEEINRSKRINPSSITTIYNPFDISEIKYKSREFNENIPKGDYWIHVGRFVQQKRHDILFQAVARMKNDLPVVLLCHKPDKALQMAKKYGVADRIITPEYQGNPYPWIRNAKGMLLSSDFEGLPTVLIESLICGTPVVSTDCPHGPSEILSGSLSEYLVPMRNPKALAQTADLLLSRDIDVSFREIESFVSSDIIAKRYLDLVKDA